MFGPTPETLDELACWGLWIPTQADLSWHAAAAPAPLRSRMVRFTGCAATDALVEGDEPYEGGPTLSVVDVHALTWGALPLPLLSCHDRNAVLGRVDQVSAYEGHLMIAGAIDLGLAGPLVQGGIAPVSIGFQGRPYRVRAGNWMEVRGRKVHGEAHVFSLTPRLTEVSLVRRGADPEAYIRVHRLRVA